jgi:low temperature requirement protein LtrA
LVDAAFYFYFFLFFFLFFPFPFLFALPSTRKVFFPMIPRQETIEGKFVQHSHHAAPSVDLFYDLVFVSTVSILAREFARALVREGNATQPLVDMLALWTPLFFVWMELQSFMNRFYSDTDKLIIAAYLGNFVAFALASMQLTPCMVNGVT